MLIILLLIAVVVASSADQECRMNRVFVPKDLEPKDLNQKRLILAGTRARWDPSQWKVVPGVCDPLSEAVEWIKSQENPKDFTVVVSRDQSQYWLCRWNLDMILIHWVDCYQIPVGEEMCPDC
jgi:hypothetical protein